MRDSSGPKNEPNYSATGAPSDAADLTEVAEYAAQIGNRRSDTDAVRQGLTGADVWDGLEFYCTDTELTWLYQGPSGAGSWVKTFEDTGWIAFPFATTPTIATPWQNFGSSYMNAQYRRKNGWVQVEGLIKGGTATQGSVIGQLPAGFRPSAHIIKPAYGAAGNNSWEVSSDGSILAGPTGVNATYTTLSMTFLAEQ